MDVWSPDHQVDPIERIKKIRRKKEGGNFNHRRHPGGSREISVFLLTFLIMDVPGILLSPEYSGTLSPEYTNT